jgi:adenosylcobinamide kinase/adenosylcobinamide-phosphate guanylyltransferase
MEVVLLGTGSATGWPDPRCTCASCQAQRAGGEIRGPTAVLVDAVLLLDGGPEAPWAAERAGRSFAAVRTMLRTDARLSASAGAARAPGGDRLDLGEHVVRALAAAASGGAVLYDVTGRSGGRLLYTATAAAFPRSTLEALTGAAYDIVLLPFDPESFPAQLRALRECGAATDRTDVVPVHLNHRSPPGPELSRWLAAWRARATLDGTVLQAPLPTARGSAGPRRVLVIGGARSGKSAEAERRLAAEPRVTYVATGGGRDDDPEWLARVASHRARRPKSWQTVETMDVAKAVAEAAEPVLVDCLTLWLAGVLEESGAWSGAVEADVLNLVEDRVTALVAAWRAAAAPVVAVTNEVGSGVVPATVSGRLFRDALGRLNQRVAAESDEVVLVVAGQAIPVRGAQGSRL